MLCTSFVPLSDPSEVTDGELTALITISTRASLKRYHTYSLTLGVSPSQASDQPSSEEDQGFVGESYTYNLQRIGTAAEKQSVEKELNELRDRLSKVEGWKRRREEIEMELQRVLTGKGESLPPPPYSEPDEDRGFSASSMGGAEMHA